MLSCPQEMPCFHNSSHFCGSKPNIPNNIPYTSPSSMSKTTIFPETSWEIHENSWRNPPSFAPPRTTQRALALGRIVQARTALRLGHKGPAHRQADAELAHDLPQQRAGPGHWGSGGKVIENCHLKDIFP